MATIEIKRFDSQKLEELAQKQTEIYNKANATDPNFTPARVEEVIKRFKNEKFDPNRMFYAYQGDIIIGYAGLTGRNVERNVRGFGYPWLLDGVNQKVRDELYEAMEEQCREEGTENLEVQTIVFQTPHYQERLDFFKTKQFGIKNEFLMYEKELKYNDFVLPKGYTLRSVVERDVEKMVEVAKADLKLKNPFNPKETLDYLHSPDFDPSYIVVAEFENNIVGMYAMFISPNPVDIKAYFAGVVVHGDHQKIEHYLFMEIENRALGKGKKYFQIMYYPDSQRLPYAKEHGYKQIRKTYYLEKKLSS